MDDVGAIAIHHQTTVDGAAVVEDEATDIGNADALQIAGGVDRQSAHGAGRERTIQVGTLLYLDIQAAQAGCGEARRIAITDNRITRRRCGRRTIGKCRSRVGKEEQGAGKRQSKLQLKCTGVRKGKETGYSVLSRITHQTCPRTRLANN